MILRLEVQTKKIDIEEMFNIVDNHLLKSDSSMPIGDIINETRSDECNTFNVTADLAKLDNTDKLTEYITALSNRLSEEQSDAEDKSNALLVQLELDFKSFDFGLVLEDLHNILAGTQEYIDNAIILSDKDSEITLAVYMDELSMFTKIHKFRVCVDYILKLINNKIDDFGSED